MAEERPTNPEEFATFIERLSIARDHPMPGELMFIFMNCLARVVSELPSPDSPESHPQWFLERLEGWLDYIYSQLGIVASTQESALNLVHNLRTTVEWLQSRPA